MFCYAFAHMSFSILKTQLFNIPNTSNPAGSKCQRMGLMKKALSLSEDLKWKLPNPAEPTPLSTRNDWFSIAAISKALRVDEKVQMYF